MTDTFEKPRRSDASRARILQAARELFAQNGYDRTTIRDIAEAASINPSLVIRYYGSKEALFAEIAVLRFEAEPLVTLPRDQMGEALVRHVIERWEHPREGAALAAMMRVSISSEAAQARISTMFAEQLNALFQAAGIEQRSPETGALIATQMLGLGLARYVLKLPPVVRLPKQLIISRIGNVVQQYIDAALADRH